MVSKTDFDIELIREIRKNELIYNIMSKDYRHKVRKEKAWSEIARNLKADKNNCYKRWKCLRDTYRKYIKNSEKVKPWKYSDEMCFLDNFKDSKRHPGVRRLVSAVHQPATDEEYEEEEDENTEQDMNPNIKQELEQDDDEDEYSFDESFAYDPSFLLETQSSNCVAAVDTNYKNSSAQLQAEKNSTELLFESLAKKIKGSNLLDSEVSAIECKVIALVYSEIDKVRQSGADMSLLEQL